MPRYQISIPKSVFNGHQYLDQAIREDDLFVVTEDGYLEFYKENGKRLTCSISPGQWHAVEEIPAEPPPIPLTPDVLQNEVHKAMRSLIKPRYLK